MPSPWIPEFPTAPSISDATAALTALRDDPGVPTSGLIALCDFGGSGTSITLVDAANGYQPVGPTVRHTEFSGDLIDQALLTQVIEGPVRRGSVDVSGTSAIGPLSRLRGAVPRGQGTAVDHRGHLAGRRPARTPRRRAPHPQ